MTYPKRDSINNYEKNRSAVLTLRARRSQGLQTKLKKYYISIKNL